VARTRPFGLSGLAFAYGYLAAGVRRTPRVEDPAFRSFVRGELRARMVAPLRRRDPFASGRAETSGARAR